MNVATSDNVDRKTRAGSPEITVDVGGAAGAGPTLDDLGGGAS